VCRPRAEWTCMHKNPRFCAGVRALVGQGTLAALCPKGEVAGPYIYKVHRKRGCGGFLSFCRYGCSNIGSLCVCSIPASRSARNRRVKIVQTYLTLTRQDHQLPEEDLHFASHVILMGTQCSLATASVPVWTTISSDGCPGRSRHSPSSLAVQQ
jgi:hypothetical protein